MKVGFYLENSDYKNVDFLNPVTGNPGIRGTQYMIWTISFMLQEKYPEQFDIYLFAPYIETLPKSIKCFQCNSDLEALDIAKQEGLNIMVLRTYTDKSDYYQKIETFDIKCIMWSHNFENYRRAQEIYNSKVIKRNVCVGRQQYERLRDHPLFSKSVCIFNTLDFENYEKKEKDRSEHRVTYVGALNSMKGFHMLAKAWPRVIAAVKDAELYVIGTGSFGSKAKLGNYNLADVHYENKFLKHLVCENGEIIPSVHFLGDVGGPKKKELMGESNVGVANPTGKGETFCIVAIEFEAMGVPVVSAKKNGLLDTVVDGKTGLLVSTEKELSDRIIELLQDADKAEKLGNAGFGNSRDAFSMDKICKQWKNLLLDVFDDKPQQVDFQYSFSNNQLKWLREMNRKVRGISALSWVPSILKYETILRDVVRNIRK
jgi:glycosyltransferase involved in cell wall biosynthesis